MYTLDEFIGRMQELRELSATGGKTPVVISSDAMSGIQQSIYENAAAEIRHARENVDIEGGCLFVDSSEESAIPVIVLF